MLNILLIGNYPPPYGGVPHHVEQFSGHLAAKGFNVHVLSGGVGCCPSPENVTVYKMHNNEKLLHLVKGIFLTVRLNLLSSSIFFESPRHAVRHIIFFSKAYEVSKQNEIGIVFTYNSLAYSQVGAWLKQTMGLVHILSVFGELFLASKTKRLSNKLLPILGSADLILSCSKHCGSSVSLLSPGLKYQHTQYGVDLRHFSYKTRSKLTDELQIMFVGRISREMGVDRVLEIADRANDLRLPLKFLVCGSTGDLSQLAEKTADRLPNLTVRQNVHYDDLPKLYQMSHVLLVTSRGARTCSSLAAMEAIACGTPVIAVDVGGVPEILNQNVGIVVNESNEAIFEQVVSLCEDRSQLAAWSSNCRRKRKEFASDAVTTKIMKLVQSVE